jgi:hypothetical protein
VIECALTASSVRAGRESGDFSTLDAHSMRESESGRAGHPREATGGPAGIAHRGDVVEDVDVG